MCRGPRMAGHGVRRLSAALGVMALASATVFAFSVLLVFIPVRSWLIPEAARHCVMVVAACQRRRRSPPPSPRRHPVATAEAAARQPYQGTGMRKRLRWTETRTDAWIDPSSAGAVAGSSITRTIGSAARSAADRRPSVGRSGERPRRIHHDDVGPALVPGKRQIQMRSRLRPTHLALVADATGRAAARRVREHCHRHVGVFQCRVGHGPQAVGRHAVKREDRPRYSLRAAAVGIHPVQEVGAVFGAPEEHLARRFEQRAVIVGTTAAGESSRHRARPATPAVCRSHPPRKDQPFAIGGDVVARHREPDSIRDEGHHPSVRGERGVTPGSPSDVPVSGIAPPKNAVSMAAAAPASRCTTHARWPARWSPTCWKMRHSR